MDNRSKNDKGIKMLVQKCREEFQRAENKNYYTDEDYKAVERKFLKLCLINKIRPLANRMR